MLSSLQPTSSPSQSPHFAALPEAERRWLLDFWTARGRRPRVLHIGNIANNAYNNAKLLNDAGLDCDVICYNYYHAMACPEWEDADFEGSVGDMFRPEWTNVDLRGFQRPKWFAQGPVDVCVDYLVARRKGDVARAERLWQRLALFNHSFRPPAKLLPSRLEQLAIHLRGRWRFLQLLTCLPMGHDLIKSRLTELRGGRGVAARSKYILFASKVAFGLTLAPIVFNVARALGLSSALGAKLQRRADALVEDFRSEFPERRDQLSEQDLAAYVLMLLQWWPLYSHYDIVQAYSTDPILPLLADQSYFAFEHGTLRDIPFSETPGGRITALSYRRAQHVFVTNFDCLENAHALAEERVTLINHPYDEDHGLAVNGWETLRTKLRGELDADFVFFLPTRHDWVRGTGYADKANDVFLRAFADLRRRGHRLGLVCCRWGANVVQSQGLIDTLGCARNVKWVEPMGMVKFERMARACDCVADQFKLGAFGGVMFKAMAVGSPVCTYLDEAAIRRQYAELPPVVNCRSEEDLLARLPPLIASPQALADAGRASRAWMKRNHGREAVVAAQVEQYRLHRPVQ